jgi:anti-sigma regulatory factor (Ser/Thr protein kinase)
VIGYSELRLNRPAHRESARPMRHAVAAFLSAVGYSDDMATDDILTAVGEALANAVEHAYDGAPCGDVEVLAHLESDRTLLVDVFDHGRFIERGERPGRGFGLRIVAAIADTFSLGTDGGTHVRMAFPGPEPP